MRQKQFLIMAALATAAGLTACSSDEEAAQTLKDTPMTISAGVDNLTTRAGYDADTDLQASSFGLFLTTAGSTDGETNYAKYNTANMEFSYDATSSAWTGASQLLWKSSSATNAVDYIAYMPYDASMTVSDTGTAAAPTDYAFSVQADQSTEENVKASDFLYYSASSFTQPTDAALPITFQHKMSKLKISMTKGTELAEDFTVSSVTLSQAQTNATINLSTGEAKAATSATQEDVKLYRTDDLDWECILVPQSLTIVITIEGSDGKTYKFTGTETETFASDTKYELSLSVGRDKVESGNNIKATAWADGNGGSLETE